LIKDKGQAISITGREIVNTNTDTAGDMSTKYADFLWKSWMPSAPWIYNSWYWDKISRATHGGRDVLGRAYSLPQAAASSLGIKISPQDVDLGFEYHRRRFKRDMGDLKAQLRRAGRDLNRNIINQEEFDKQKTHITGKMQYLQTKAKEDLRR